MPPRPLSSSSKRADARANSLGLDAAGLARVTDLLDRRRSGGTASKRTHSRKPFRMLSVGLELTQPRGPSVHLRLAARNLSSSGICLLHSAYMHTGTPCVVTLTSLSGRERSMPGVVTRCAHVAGRAHEIGIRFSDAITLAEFIDRESVWDSYSLERVEPEQLAGSVVLLGVPTIQDRIIRHHLRDSRLSIRSAQERSEWEAALCDVADLVVLDEHTLVEHGAGVFEGPLRSVVCPLVLLSIPERTPSEPTVGGRSLPRIDTPIDQENLLRALGEVLIVQGVGTNAEGGSGADDELVRLVISDLGRIVDDTKRCIVENERDGLLRSAKELTSAGQVLGLDELVTEAGQISEALANGLKPDDTICTQALLRLTRVVQRLNNSPGGPGGRTRAA